MAGCDTGGKVQNSPDNTNTIGASTVRPESTVSTVVSPTSIPTPIATSAQAGENTDMAVRFGEAIGIQNNWLEVLNPESLRGLTEFTFMANVRLRSGVAAQFVQSDAVASLGSDVEAIGVFTSIFSCFDTGIAVVIDDDRYCSHIGLPRDQVVSFGVIFKDQELRIIAGDIISEPIKTKKGISLVTGNFFIGASPKGTDEGFSGDISDLVILKKALTPEEVKIALGKIRTNNTRMLLVNNGDVAALWTFDKIDGFKDLSGHGNNATPHGEVSQVEVSK